MERGLLVAWTGRSRKEARRFEIIETGERRHKLPTRRGELHRRPRIETASPPLSIATGALITIRISHDILYRAALRLTSRSVTKMN